MYKIIFCFIFINLYNQLSLASSQKPELYTIYDIKDLKALKSDSSFREFFQHAKDIRPGQRDKEWDQLVQSMSMGLLDQLSKSKSITDKDFELVKTISSWTQIKEDEFFLRKRNSVALKYFGQCFKTNSWDNCYNPMLDFYTKFDNSPESGLNMAKLLVKHNSIMNTKDISEQIIIKYDLWPFVSAMAKSPLSEFYCHKEPMQLIVVNKLYQMTKSDKNFQVNNLLHKDCFKALIPSFKENLLTANNPYIREKTYTILDHNSFISKTDRSEYYLLQLLDGVVFNKKQTLDSFELLKKIAEDYKLRDELLLKLKKIIPLPGKVFTYKTKSALAISRGLSRYFPEYVDYYASTCLSHLSGESTTVGGNPATYCHEFYNTAKLVKIIPKAKIQNYDKIMNSWKK